MVVWFWGKMSGFALTNSTFQLDLKFWYLIQISNFEGFLLYGIDLGLIIRLGVVFSWTWLLFLVLFSLLLLLLFTRPGQSFAPGLHSSWRRQLRKLSKPAPGSLSSLRAQSGTKEVGIIS